MHFSNRNVQTDALIKFFIPLKDLYSANVSPVTDAIRWQMVFSQFPFDVQDVSKFNDISVSWTSPETDLLRNILNLEN